MKKCQNGNKRDVQLSLAVATCRCAGSYMQHAKVLWGLAQYTSGRVKYRPEFYQVLSVVIFTDVDLNHVI